ncbi:MAG: hypothetical protein ACXAD7_25470 [Candidatus Kariarchaeaceae archaeon]|jgi:hypothetical protein
MGYLLIVLLFIIAPHASALNADELCMGQYDHEEPYGSFNGSTGIRFGGGSAINMAFWKYQACVRHDCQKPGCYWTGNGCEEEFFNSCPLARLQDAISGVICELSYRWQDLKITWKGSLCPNGSRSRCPTGVCKGCLGYIGDDGTWKAKDWCQCLLSEGGSLDCPDGECCGYGGVDVCGTINDNHGWGMCPRFQNNGLPPVWDHCGFKGSYSYYHSCYDPTHPPITGGCGWSGLKIQGVDFITGGVTACDGECCHNPKKSCHYCKGEMVWQEIPTACNLGEH